MDPHERVWFADQYKAKSRGRGQGGGGGGRRQLPVTREESQQRGGGMILWDGRTDKNRQMIAVTLSLRFAARVNNKFHYENHENYDDEDYDDEDYDHEDYDDNGSDKDE